MKPDWDKLMDDFKDSTTSLVADVDCTTEGKALCEKHEIKGYPTIKYGDPNDLQEYKGGRTYDDFKEFADTNLGPSCGPENLDLCKVEDKAVLEQLMALSLDELDEKIKEADEAIAKIEAKGTKAVSKVEAKIKDLQNKISLETKKKDGAVAKEKKKTGVTLMKAVVAGAKKKDNESSKKKSRKKKNKDKEL